MLTRAPFPSPVSLYEAPLSDVEPDTPMPLVGTAGRLPSNLMPIHSMRPQDDPVPDNPRDIVAIDSGMGMYKGMTFQLSPPEMAQIEKVVAKNIARSLRRMAKEIENGSTANDV